ncbi:MAG: adenosine deaminase, partial [Bryobacteraceae bacterium]|nr:adenosine deaminase [Bryobacteraceae bacterium]
GWFRDLFALVRDNGLAVLPHAGETDGADSVWACLNMGASRIGHGIRAIEDPGLVQYLREKRIPLEICITSNLCTGVVSSLREHPVRRLFDAGVPIVLNTDDPALFRTSLSSEYRLAAEHFGFTDDELRTVAANSLAFRSRSPSDFL